MSLQEVGEELPAVLKRCQPLTLARLPARSSWSLYTFFQFEDLTFKSIKSAARKKALSTAHPALLLPDILS